MLALLAHLITLYELILVVRILFTWVHVNPWSAMGRFVRILASITDPVLNPIRRVIPPIRTGGMALDLSPMILLVVLSIIAGRL